jgi:hypothetical protein
LLFGVQAFRRRFSGLATRAPRQKILGFPNSKERKFNPLILEGSGRGSRRNQRGLRDCLGRS